MGGYFFMYLFYFIYFIFAKTIQKDFKICQTPLRLLRSYEHGRNIFLAIFTSGNQLYVTLCIFSLQKSAAYVPLM